MDFDIEDTYCEAFIGTCVRMIVTAEDDKTIEKIAYDACATPGTVIGRTESGVEKFLSPDQTPDNRPGVLIQFWYNTKDLAKFDKELSFRIRQDILVKPFVKIFDASIDPFDYIDTTEHVGHCGDGYEWTEEIYGRTMIRVPICVPDFYIEQKLGCMEGIMGVNFWYYCSSKEAVLEAGYKSLDALAEVDGICTPFDICSAGSKVETNYPEIGPTTNHPYCPSLKEKIGDESKVEDGVNYIPEIVINALTLEDAKNSLIEGINALNGVEGVLKVSAGNYGGNLGKYKFYLKKMLE
ncbi:formylmethanofuran--tetrahydromethanopterin N-formyltransferase [Methanosphaera sp. BMS]|uniref:formylmethanofuran--tetrahydromethanopterin N-formyltransferase n=1 Tax=Methanosphaera sp. BMS TaxID=1789762 RepID=UPI000DC1D370|nr:formylmethanofuran--tetrahydromethanopterin N-formyltransferase [Methanosphaera sp. BMS]AWX32838.1 formylmethanofuran--tetrahydromethanopterin formyltransferase [Methanosphaera sp. BMS]